MQYITIFLQILWKQISWQTNTTYSPNSPTFWNLHFYCLQNWKPSSGYWASNNLKISIDLELLNRNKMNVDKPYHKKLLWKHKAFHRNETFWWKSTICTTSGRRSLKISIFHMLQHILIFTWIHTPKRTTDRKTVPLTSSINHKGHTDETCGFSSRCDNIRNCTTLHLWVTYTHNDIAFSTLGETNKLLNWPF